MERYDMLTIAWIETTKTAGPTGNGKMPSAMQCFTEDTQHGKAVHRVWIKVSLHNTEALLPNHHGNQHKQSKMSEIQILCLGWFIISIWPLLCGWTPEERLTVIPKRQQSSDQTLTVDWGSQSETMSYERPFIQNTCWSGTSIVSAERSMKCAILKKWSTVGLRWSFLQAATKSLTFLGYGRAQVLLDWDGYSRMTGQVRGIKMMGEGIEFLVFGTKIELQQLVLCGVHLKDKGDRIRIGAVENHFFKADKA